MGARHGQKLGWLRKWLYSCALWREHDMNFYSVTHCTQYSDKRQLCNCNLTLLHTKELKGDKWASRSTTTEIAYTVCTSDSCSTMLFYRCFQCYCQYHCDKKSKEYSWLSFLLFRSSRRQHEVQAVSLCDGGVLLFVCMSVCDSGCLSCRSLLVTVFGVIYCCRRAAGPFTTQ